MSRRPAVPCKAQTTSGRPCRRYAMHGQQVCATHGGRAPQAKLAAARRQAEAEALKALERQGVRAIENPLLELQDVASEIVSLKDWLRGRLDVLLKVRTDGGEVDPAGLAAYERALDRCTRVLADIARLDIDERLVRIQAMQASRHAQIGVTVMTKALMMVFGAAPLPLDMRLLLGDALAAESGRRPDGRLADDPGASLRKAVAYLGLRVTAVTQVDEDTGAVRIDEGDLDEPWQEFVRWLRRRWVDATRVAELEEKLAAEVGKRVELDEHVRKLEERLRVVTVQGRAPLALPAGSSS